MAAMLSSQVSRMGAKAGPTRPVPKRCRENRTSRMATVMAMIVSAQAQCWSRHRMTDSHAMLVPDKPWNGKWPLSWLEGRPNGGGASVCACSQDCWVC